jgi:hypothetical protein
VVLSMTVIELATKLTRLLTAATRGGGDGFIVKTMLSPGSGTCPPAQLAAVPQLLSAPAPDQVNVSATFVTFTVRAWVVVRLPSVTCTVTR